MSGTRKRGCRAAGPWDDGRAGALRVRGDSSEASVEMKGKGDGLSQKVSLAARNKGSLWGWLV